MTIVTKELEGVKNRAVHLDFRWKSPKFTWNGSSLQNAADPARDFLKIWPCCLQRHFERLRLFYLNTEMIVKQGFRVFWWWC